MASVHSAFATQKPGPIILILGGSGFIGTRLTTLLTEAGMPAQIGDLKPSTMFANLWTECDVRHRDTFAPLARGAGAIINLAAAHRDDVRPVSLYREVNIDGAAEVCSVAGSEGIQKIVFTSSVAVYGFHPAPVDESGPFVPFNQYGKTKLEAEGIYRTWAAEDPARTLVIVRPAVVFGEGNRGNVYNLLRQIAAGRFFMVGDGKNIKSMAYVGNIAAFLVHVLNLGPGTHIFNYVDGPDIDTHSLVEHIRRCLHRQRSIPRIPLPLALAGGRVFDAVARITGRTFPISAIRVRKFCENTQFLAERIDSSGFVRPFTLLDALDRTIQFEFPSNTADSASAFVPGHG
jgi:GlcNAc-P-P-Und epimerase